MHDLDDPYGELYIDSKYVDLEYSPNGSSMSFEFFVAIEERGTNPSQLVHARIFIYIYYVNMSSNDEYLVSKDTRMTFTDHMNQTMSSIISSTDNRVRNGEGKHLEDLLGLCDMFPSSGVLRIRLALAVIILRHCIYPPDYDTTYRDEVQRAAGWGYSLMFFDPDDWQESYMSIMDLKTRLFDSNDAAILHPVPNIRCRDRETRSSKPLNLCDAPQPMDIDQGSNPLNYIIRSDALQEDFNDMILRIRVMQALSYFVPYYLHESDEEQYELDQDVVAEYHAFVMDKFQTHPDVQSLLLSILEEPHLPTNAPKSQTAVRDIMSKNSTYFDHVIFQNNLDLFCKKVNNLLPGVNRQKETPSETNKTTQSLQPLVDNVDHHNTSSEPSPKITVEETFNNTHEDALDKKCSSLFAQTDTPDKDVHAINHDGTNVESHTQHSSDSDSIASALNAKAINAHQTKQRLEDEFKSTSSPNTTNEDTSGEMENPVRILQEKRFQLMSSITEDPIVKSKYIASQAMIRVMETHSDSRDRRNEYSEVHENHQPASTTTTTTTTANHQERDDGAIRESKVIEQRCDDNNKTQDDDQRTQSALYGTKRSRSQVRWDGALTDHDDMSVVTDPEQPPKQHSEKTVTVVKVEHKPRKPRVNYTAEEKQAIINGVKVYGVGKWYEIKHDDRFKTILMNRTTVQIKVRTSFTCPISLKSNNFIN